MGEAPFNRCDVLYLENPHQAGLFEIPLNPCARAQKNTLTVRWYQRKVFKKRLIVGWILRRLQNSGFGGWGDLELKIMEIYILRWSVVETFFWGQKKKKKSRWITAISTRWCRMYREMGGRWFGLYVPVALWAGRGASLEGRHCSTRFLITKLSNSTSLTFVKREVCYIRQNNTDIGILRVSSQTHLENNPSRSVRPRVPATRQPSHLHGHKHSDDKPGLQHDHTSFLLDVSKLQICGGTNQGGTISFGEEKSSTLASNTETFTQALQRKLRAQIPPQNNNYSTIKRAHVRCCLPPVPGPSGSPLLWWKRLLGYVFLSFFFCALMNRRYY